HYTAARRRRSDDAYTPDARHDMRPDYPTIVYSECLRRLFPDVPIIAGGIEASLRRLSHYDYWQDRIRPSILADSKADMIIYGMGEKPIVELARRLDAGEKINEITDLRQSAVMVRAEEIPTTDTVDNIVLAPYDVCVKDPRRQSANFRIIEQESNRLHPEAVIWQRVDRNRAVRVNPMYPPMTTEEIDASFDLPYTRLPHPRYKNKRIPAYDMIRHSVNLHRGCFGGCAFCTISAHQGKFIASRSKESILREVRQVTRMPDYKGYISDLGGPSANMYGMKGKDLSICVKCLRPSCLHPKPCRNLNTDHGPLLDIYHAVDAMPEVKKSFVGSGVRYDLSMHHTGDRRVDDTNRRYNEELIANHVSGRLKVAPEHTSDAVLEVMRKPSFELFYKFRDIFDRVNRERGLKQQLIPYFISSHPGCREVDMAELACITRDMSMHLEQVQDFTPTPMTVSTEIYATGFHPYTGERVYTAVSPDDKKAQRQYFFWYDPEYRDGIMASLRRMHRPDLVARLFPAYRDPRHAASHRGVSSAKNESRMVPRHKKK
ncbi:MAG: YgiQ family radical SAM protein, partial [Muribaculaceae bacterium]|nr:YgiQ family radical SAM protein [Muribaculaceae bacterium]